jgi:DNA segregation ATPase FtsK/SpoIIIE-like protein
MDLINSLKKRAGIETVGFLLIGFGLFLGMVLATQSLAENDRASETVRNLGGPWGQSLASMMLRALGVVSYLYPLGMILLGIVAAMGRASWPRPRRISALIFLSIVMAGLARLVSPVPEGFELDNGIGGTLGANLGQALLNTVGFGGALISLGLIGSITLVITARPMISSVTGLFDWRSRARQPSTDGPNSTAIGTSPLVAGKSLAAAGPDGAADASGNGAADASGNGKVDASENGKAEASDNGKAETSDNGKAEASDNGKAEASDNGKVDASDDGKAEAAENGKVDASGNGQAGASRNRAAETNGSAETDGQLSDDSGPLTMDLNPFDTSNAKPDVEMFQIAEIVRANGSDTDTVSTVLTEQLREFKVDGKVTHITDGPLVTTFEYQPSAGTRVNRIVSLGGDLARLLKAPSLRVIAPIPGKDTVGFEVPNHARRSIGFGNVIDTPSFTSKSKALPIGMGVDTFGKPVIEDLATMPHILVAGSTGSGKSVFLNTLIASLICRRSAKELRMVMIDPKMVELTSYNDLPHMACEVITDVQSQCLPILEQLVSEMERRYRQLRAVGAKNIIAFNEVIRTKRKTKYPRFKGKWQRMPYIVVVIEEFADFVLVLGKDAETQIVRLAQKARAAGIHLVIATQRPSADVVTGLIKANFPTRVAFRVTSAVDSRTIIDTSGAENLMGRGDMLYQSPSGLHRLHAAFLSEDEITNMVRICAGGVSSDALAES